VRVVDDLDVRLERAEDGVVLDEVGRLLDAAGVVDGDDVEEGVLAPVPAAEEVAAWDDGGRVWMGGASATASRERGPAIDRSTDRSTATR
jgi:hypothetical protein